jgi:hypothetical protein
MTRKDYINLSNAIRATNDRIRNERDEKLAQPGLPHVTVQLIKDRRDEQLRGVRRAAAAICDALADDNPRFDQSQFLKACGYGGVVRATQPADTRQAWREREETDRQPRRLPDINSY